MSRLNTFIGLCAIMIASGLNSKAQAEGDFQFALHGFTSLSFYQQTSPSFILNGQGPMLLAGATKNTTVTGMDVRQTRLNFSVTGPQVFAAAPKGVVEVDFFGLNTPGGYGEVSVSPRLRLAYSEFKWADDVVRAGQDWQLLFAQAPTSVGHLAYPVVFFAGLIGWREPQITWYHTQHLNSSNLEYAVSVMKSDWANPYDFGDSTTQDLNVNDGQLSSTPGLEARVKWSLENSMVFAAFHTNHVGASKEDKLVIAPTTTPTRDFDVTAFKIGGKTTLGDFALALDLYSGKNLAPLLGESLVFNKTADVQEIGGWAQAGYNFNPIWSLWAIYGTSQPKTSDVAANVATSALRGGNTVYGGMVQAKEGNLSVALEVTGVTTKLVSADSSTTNTSGTQYMLSTNYAF